MSDFKSKEAPNSISDGAPPQTTLGELAALSHIPAKPITAFGPPGLETTCLPKYVSLNPPMTFGKVSPGDIIYAGEKNGDGTFFP